MKGVVPVIESILLAAAVILFMVGIAGALNNFVNMVTEQRLKNTLRIDAEKVAYGILLVKKVGESGKGEVKIYLDLADIPEEITVKDDGVHAKSGREEVVVSLYGAERYVNKSFNRLTNTKGYEPYVLYVNGDIRLGVE